MDSCRRYIAPISSSMTNINNTNPTPPLGP
jgi:hypothetical protein